MFEIEVVQHVDFKMFSISVRMSVIVVEVAFVDITSIVSENTPSQSIRVDISRNILKNFTVDVIGGNLNTCMYKTKINFKYSDVDSAL